MSSFAGGKAYLEGKMVDLQQKVDTAAANEERYKAMAVEQERLKAKYQGELEIAQEWYEEEKGQEPEAETEGERETVEQPYRQPVRLMPSSTIKSRVEKLFDENPESEFTPKSIFEILQRTDSSVKDNAVHTVVGRLLDAGEIEKVGNALYRKSKKGAIPNATTATSAIGQLFWRGATNTSPNTVSEDTTE